MVDLPDFWTVCGIALALIGGAATVISVPGPGHWEFRVARACFVGAAVLFFVKIAVWGMVELNLVRMSITAIVGALTAIGLAVALHWVQVKQDRHMIPRPSSVGMSAAQPTPQPSPDVTIAFVYARRPALALLNTSSMVARQIKWTVLLWNLDNPMAWSNADIKDAHEALRIPISTFDFLRPGTSGGPQDLFDSPLVLPFIKNGDHLIGTASIECSDCEFGHTFIVEITLGVGGWYYEIPNDTSGKLLIPQNQTKEGVVIYAHAMRQLAEEKGRIAIPEGIAPPTNPPAAPPPSPAQPAPLAGK